MMLFGYRLFDGCFINALKFYFAWHRKLPLSFNVVWKKSLAYIHFYVVSSVPVSLDSGGKSFVCYSYEFKEHCLFDYNPFSNLSHFSHKTLWRSF